MKTYNMRQLNGCLLNQMAIKQAIKYQNIIRNLIQISILQAKKSDSKSTSSAHIVTTTVATFRSWRDS